MFKNIGINNFRGIKNLEIDNLRMINVFVGPNNCGKTTIIEALFMMIGMSNPKLYDSINTFRNLLISENNDLRLNFRNLDFNNEITLESFIKKSGKRSLRIDPIYSETFIKTPIDKKMEECDSSSNPSNTIENFDHAIGLNFNFNKSGENHLSKLTLENNTFHINYDENYKELLNGRFFSSSTIYNDLPKRIDKIQRDKKKDMLIDVLKKIEPNLIDIALSTNRVVYVDIGIDQMIPINLMGGGFVKACSLITNFFLIPDGYLLIDEIENGLHYETLKIVWDAIIASALKYNLQIFLTTQSSEALTVLINVILNNNYDKNDIGIYSIQKIKPDTHKAYRYNFDSLEANVKSEVEVRGKLIG